MRVWRAAESHVEGVEEDAELAGRRWRAEGCGVDVDDGGLEPWASASAILDLISPTKPMHSRQDGLLGAQLLLPLPLAVVLGYRRSDFSASLRALVKLPSRIAYGSKRQGRTRWQCYVTWLWPCGSTLRL